jgi:nitrite reductase/ring-hydroxylating ferredoxin subunit
MMIGNDDRGDAAMPFVKVATVQEIPPGQAKQVTLPGRTLALFNCDGTYYALDDECPHSGGPLSEGILEGKEVECPWHSARFDVTSGAHLCPPARKGVRAYPVRVVGDEVQVDV